MNVKLLSVTLLLGLAIACSKRDKASAPAAAVASAAGFASLPMPVNPRAEAIPTEQDFEEEATRDLTAANLDAELERLGKEIQP